MNRKGASKITVIACLVATLALAFFCGLAWPLELVIWLAVGWLSFLNRVASQIRPDWNAIATAAAALALFSLGLHWFLHWLASARGQSQIGQSLFNWKPRWTVAIVAIIVTMFVAGTASIGVSHQLVWMASSNQPVFNSNFVREPAQRAQSANNLRNLAVAFDLYAKKHGAYPPATTLSGDGRTLHGWQTFILPFIEQQRLYDKIDLEIPWHDASHKPQFTTELKLYLMPGSDVPIRDGSGYALSHYALNQHAVGGSAHRKRDDFPDGASNTLLIGEVAGNYKPWGSPTNWRDPATGINTSPDGFGSPWVSRGAHFVFADGRTRFISEKIDPKVLRALATPTGSDPIPPDAF